MSKQQQHDEDDEFGTVDAGEGDLTSFLMDPNDDDEEEEGDVEEEGGEEDEDEEEDEEEGDEKKSIASIKQQLADLAKANRDLQMTNAALLAGVANNNNKQEAEEEDPTDTAYRALAAALAGKTGPDLVDALEGLNGDQLLTILNPKRAGTDKQVEALQRQVAEERFKAEYPALRDVFTNFATQAELEAAMKKPVNAAFMTEFKRLKAMGADPIKAQYAAADHAIKTVMKPPRGRAPLSMMDDAGGGEREGGAPRVRFDRRDLSMAAGLGLSKKDLARIKRGR